MTRAGAGFVDTVAELAIGFMVDLGRGISRSAQDYRAGCQPAIREGVQLAGAALGIVGYGAIGRRLAQLAQALGMIVRVSAPDQMPSILLAGRPDVIATPHVGGLTPQAVRHQAFDTVAQVAAIAAGRMPPGAVNPDAAARLMR